VWWCCFGRQTPGTHTYVNCESMEKGDVGLQARAAHTLDHHDCISSDVHSDASVSVNIYCKGPITRLVSHSLMLQHHYGWPCQEDGRRGLD
jgi:hypothetical protein